VTNEWQVRQGCWQQQQQHGLARSEKCSMCLDSGSAGSRTCLGTSQPHKGTVDWSASETVRALLDLLFVIRKGRTADGFSFMWAPDGLWLDVYYSISSSTPSAVTVTSRYPSARCTIHMIASSCQLASTLFDLCYALCRPALPNLNTIPAGHPLAEGPFPDAKAWPSPMVQAVQHQAPTDRRRGGKSRARGCCCCRGCRPCPGCCHRCGF
jgi:hypothetical protein